MAQLALSNTRVSVLACRNAVLGGRYGQWRLKREPDISDTININLYFDEDAAEDSTASVGEEQAGNEIWTGEGELILPDFAKLVAFLQSMIYS